MVNHHLLPPFEDFSLYFSNHRTSNSTYWEGGQPNLKPKNPLTRSNLIRFFGYWDVHGTK